MSKLNTHSSQSKHPFIGESVRHSLAEGAFLFNKMEKVCGIYKITSPTKKIYIGQSINIYKRISYYKTANCKGQAKLYASIKKYGWDSHLFEIIHKCHEKELNDLEVYYMDLFQTFNSKFGLNLQSGGLVMKQSDETKLKRSNTLKGRVFTQEWKDKIGAKSKGRMIGYKFSEDVLIKMRGRKISDETKKKISIANKGKGMSKEDARQRRIISNRDYRNRISIRDRGIPTKKYSIDVINNATGEVFQSITSAAKSINMKEATLRAMLKGENKNKTTFSILQSTNKNII